MASTDHGATLEKIVMTFLKKYIYTLPLALANGQEKDRKGGFSQNSYSAKASFY